MNSRSVNTLLYTTAGALAIGAVGGLLFGVLWPLEREDTAATAAAQATQPTTAAALPSLAAFEKIWATPLRQALGTPAPAAPEPPPAPVVAGPAPMPAAVEPSGVPVSLVGTIGESIALFKTVTNVVEVCAVGESFNGVTVVAVRPAEVDVMFNGQMVKLAKPAEK